MDAPAQMRLQSASFRQEVAQDGMQDAAIAIVVDLDRRIEANGDLELRRVAFAVVSRGHRKSLSMGWTSSLRSGCRRFRARSSPSDLYDSPSANVSGKHAHHHQIAAVNPLNAFGDYGFDAEQQRTLRRPIAR